MKTTVDAEAAFGLFYELFRVMPWLINAGRDLRPDPDAETEAIAFLLDLSAGNAEGWGTTRVEAQDTAALLLIDFFAKLRQPGPISQATWLVNADARPHHQALEILAHELRASHPRQTKPN